MKENILSFLSRKNVLPMYGFPVDTVEMAFSGRGKTEKLGLQLQRDLAMAISEYAPGSQIIANGNLLTSKYIRKIPNMSWKMYDYVPCSCKTLNIHIHDASNKENNLKECRQCGDLLDTNKIRTFLIPEFGFEADGDRIRVPGLIKPEKTYRGDISYVGYKDKINKTTYIKNGTIFELLTSQVNELAVLNESNFFVCDACGYTKLDNKMYANTILENHVNSKGRKCVNKILKKFSLGYRFETDAVQIRFMKPDLYEINQALSVLYGLLLGISRYLSIDENDISGCLQSYMNEYTGKRSSGLILFDKTPGGAGHIRRLSNDEVITGVLDETLKLVSNCDCGGEEGDSSCYSCLRSYYNQKYHDILKRKFVINFIKDFISKSQLNLIHKISFLL